MYRFQDIVSQIVESRIFVNATWI